MFHGGGSGCFLFLPSFIMAPGLPQNRYTQRTNETDSLLLMAEIGIGGVCYRIFNHISRRGYFCPSLGNVCL